MKTNTYPKSLNY